MRYDFSKKISSSAFAWKQMQDWRIRQNEHRKAFETTMANVSNTMVGAMNNFHQTMGHISAQRALDRVSAASAAKAEQARAAANSVNMRV